MDSAPGPISPLADRATEPSGVGVAVVEGHLLLATALDRTSTVLLRMERRRRIVRNRPVEPGGHTVVHVAHLRAGRLPLVIVADGIETGHDRWEFRSSGLWAEAVCEQPGLHWSYGLEAFAIAIDQPDEMLGLGYGHRTPLGWELDFESRQPVIETELPLCRSWQQSGSLNGLLQLLPEAGADLAASPTRPDGPANPAGIDWQGLPDWLANGLIGDDTGEEPDGIDRPFVGTALRRHWWGIDPAAAYDLAELPHTPSIAEPATRIAFPLDPDDAAKRSSAAAGAEGRRVWWLGHDGQTWTSEVTTEPER